MNAVPEALFLLWAAVLWLRRTRTDAVDGVLLVLAFASWLQIAVTAVLDPFWLWRHGAPPDLYVHLRRYEVEAAITAWRSAGVVTPVVVAALVAAARSRGTRTERVLAALVAISALLAVGSRRPVSMLRYDVTSYTLHAHGFTAPVREPPPIEVRSRDD